MGLHKPVTGDQLFVQSAHFPGYINKIQLSLTLSLIANFLPLFGFVFVLDIIDEYLVNTCITLNKLQSITVYSISSIYSIMFYS